MNNEPRGLFGQRVYPGIDAGQERFVFETETPIADRRSVAPDCDGQQVIEDRTMFDEGDVISSYTTDQAIADGCLVKPSPETHPTVVWSRALFDAVVEKEGWRWIPQEDGGCHLSCKGKEYKQRVVPFIMDAVMIVRAGLVKDPDEMLWTRGLEGNLTGRDDVWMELNDIGGFTMMFPEDR